MRSPRHPIPARAFAHAVRLCGGALLLWLVASCQGSGGLWGQATTPCNPLESGVLQRSALWDSTFGSDGAVGCLRVAWGALSELSDEGARTALVKLSPEGVLRGFNPQEDRFDAPLRLTLPQDAQDIFVAKISDKGIWRWCKTAGGKGIDLAAAITTNAANEIFVTGLFSDAVTFGGIQLTSRGKSDIFIWKTGPGPPGP